MIRTCPLHAVEDSRIDAPSRGGGDQEHGPGSGQSRALDHLLCSRLGAAAAVGCAALLWTEQRPEPSTTAPRRHRRCFCLNIELKAVAFLLRWQDYLPPAWLEYTRRTLVLEVPVEVGAPVEGLAHEAARSPCR